MSNLLYCLRKDFTQNVIPDFIKICENTPQLCWGDEWPTLSPGACLREAASAKAGERVRVRGK
jgi:hypothetical protein